MQPETTSIKQGETQSSSKENEKTSDSVKIKLKYVVFLFCFFLTIFYHFVKTNSNIEYISGHWMLS